MKSKPRNFLLRTLEAVLVLLGFSACGEEIKSDEIPVEYGCPYMSYRIVGTVTDENNAPIKGIKVVISDSHRFDKDADVTVYTDADGKFTGSHVESFDLSEQTVSFEDVDGEDNGGLFKSATLGLDDMTKKKLKDGGNWYKGDYEITANVKLEREQPAEAE